MQMQFNEGQFNEIEEDKLKKWKERQDSLVSSIQLSGEDWLYIGKLVQVILDYKTVSHSVSKLDPVMHFLKSLRLNHAIVISF